MSEQPGGIIDPRPWPPSPYPGDNLGWSTDATAYIVSGATVRPEEDYPCEDPPCLRQGGAEFRSGRSSLLSLNRTRAVNLVGVRNTSGEPLCRHHYGYWTVNDRGRLAPVVFSKQFDGGNDDDEVFVSVGQFTVIDDADRDEEFDLLGFGTPGRAVAVNTIRLPEWVEGAFDSIRRPCGIVPF